MSALESSVHGVRNRPLTGLYNRRGGEVMVTQRFGNGNPYIFLMMDIDNFKAVNDIYGHHEGDEVLRYIADSLRQFFRQDDGDPIGEDESSCSFTRQQCRGY